MAANDETTAIYHGLIWTDGNGNLLAYDATFDPTTGEETPGPNHGRPIAYHEGSYIFLNPGEPSHNERHSVNVLEVDGTVDASMTDDESLVNADSTENAHHFAVQEDDPHYDPDAPNGVKLTSLSAREADTFTGHTDAPANTGGGE
jgi:hypothetical protein